MKRSVVVTMVLAVALFGVVPVAVCEMTPACCPQAASCDMPQMACQTPEILAATAPRSLERLPVLDLAVASLRDGSERLAEPSLYLSPAAFPSTVPKFLLTHTFRL